MRIYINPRSGSYLKLEKVDAMCAPASIRNPLHNK